MTASSSPAVLELARIAAYCRNHTAAEVRAEINARVRELRDQPVNSLTVLGMYARNCGSATRIRDKARARIRALTGRRPPPNRRIRTLKGQS
jgi:hypothetical protein